MTSSLCCNSLWDWRITLDLVGWQVKIEIAIPDEKVNDAVAAIIEGARTGKIGDGKIFISPLEEVVRIRTEDRGAQAI